MERMLSVLVAVVVLLAVPTLPSHSATALSAERMGTITGGCQTGPCGNTNPANRCNHPLCESKRSRAPIVRKICCCWYAWSRKEAPHAPTAQPIPEIPST